MLTLDTLKKQLEPYKNTLVIDLHKICILLDVIEDDEDFYWVYNDGKKTYYGSCVLDWTPLKGYIDNYKYINLIDIWNGNYDTQAV